MGSQKLKLQERVLQEPAPDPLAICYGCQLGVVLEPLTVELGECLSLQPVTSYWISMPSLDMRPLLSCLIESCLVDVSWRSAFIQRRNRERVDLGLQKVAGQKEQIKGILVRMYCITEESIFNFKTDCNFKYSMKAKVFISSKYKLVT